MSAGIRKKLSEAVSALRRGDLAHADHCCTQVLRQAPRNPLALHVSGVVRLQRGELPQALELLGRAVELDPDNTQALQDLGAAEMSGQTFSRAESLFRRAIARGKNDGSVYSWLGIALASQGRYAEAAGPFEQAATLEPRNPDHRVNLGNAQRELNQLAQAISTYRSALGLAPTHVGALLSLAAALDDFGKTDEAVEYYRSALAHDRHNTNARYGLAVALNKQRMHSEAASHLQALLGVDPKHIDALIELGIALEALGSPEDAERRFREAIELDAANPEAYNNLGSALDAQGRYEEAISCFERALSLCPESNMSVGGGSSGGAAAGLSHVTARRPTRAVTYFNLAIAQRALGKYEEAIASSQNALALSPNYTEAWNNLGVIYQDLGRFDDALSTFRKVLKIQPDHPDLTLSMGVAFLYLGDFSEGWKYWEARFDAHPPRAMQKNLASPTVTAETLRATRRLAVWAEQGLGDEILYSSLIPELMAQNVNFVYELDRRLLRTYQRSFPGKDFVARDDVSTPALDTADANIAAGSLPRLFRTRRSDFSRQERGFLKSDPERRGGFRERMDPSGESFCVAISWKSTHGARRRLVQRAKSATLGCFASLAAVTGVRLVDVQYGDTEAERWAFMRQNGVDAIRMEDVDHLRDVDGVIGVIDACDLVITTCNVTAHFAGALGKPTWLLYLNDRAPFFYWVRGEAGRSLWYPSVEIVSGADLGRWEDLLSVTARRLQEHIGARY